MTPNENRESLLKAINDLVGARTAEERQNILIKVGGIAASIDSAALGDPDAAAIKIETDDLVEKAELITKVKDEYDELDQSLPTPKKSIVNITKI